MNKRLVVIGGGAAGFFCAINAAASNPQLEVIIIERSGKLLSKVRVSGGGRCNVTHACFSIPEMVKNYPRGSHFLKKSFQSFFTTDTIKWFEDRGVVLKTEADGRMFPVTNSSETIVDCLVREANKYKVQIMMNNDVRSIMTTHGNNHRDKAKEDFVDNKAKEVSGDDKSKEDLEGNKAKEEVLEDESIPLKGQSITLTCANGEEIATDFLCIACGGFSKPAQFDWIKNLGHSIEPPVPSLFTFNLADTKITELMGITIEKVVIKIVGTKFSQEGPLLITHWGFSGPAVLKLSAFAAIELASTGYRYKVVINWLPGFNENTLREELSGLRTKLAGQKIINRNPFYLPQRLWSFFLQQSGIHEDVRWADLPAKQQNLLVKNLCTNEFEVKGKTTFKEEFVTSGGVSLAEIDPNTMESKIVKHLYFAGEVMNVDGITGGFNFQHAWTSGWIAGNAIGKEAQ